MLDVIIRIGYVIGSGAPASDAIATGVMVSVGVVVNDPVKRMFNVEVPVQAGSWCLF